MTGTAEPYAECATCAAIFPVPPVAECPDCGGRYLTAAATPQHIGWERFDRHRWPPIPNQVFAIQRGHQSGKSMEEFSLDSFTIVKPYCSSFVFPGTQRFIPHGTPVYCITLPPLT